MPVPLSLGTLTVWPAPRVKSGRLSSNVGCVTLKVVV